MKKIVTIGGGTGSFIVLRGLKAYDYDITAVVNMFDSGGSSGILRDEFGVLPPGDVRRALLALSSGPQAQIVRDLFNFRFDESSTLQGHNFGNLLLVALSELYGGDAQAIQKASQLLSIKGRVLPVTLDMSHVHAVLKDGETIIGETNIDIPKHDGTIAIERVYLSPPAVIHTPVVTVLHEADMIILCPGDLYSSLIPTLSTVGMREALMESKATKIWICNSMTKWGETNDFTASDFAREIAKYSGIEMLDHVLINTQPIDEELREEYAKERKFPVQLDETELLKYTKHIIGSNLLSKTDLVRFDSDVLAGIIRSIF